MTSIEIEILNKIREVITPFWDRLAEFITNLGGQEILILVIIAIYFVISKKMGQRIAFSIFTSLLLNNTIKVLVDRVRPFYNDKRTYTLTDNVIKDASGKSFPSGHSQNSAVTYTSIALAFKKKYLWIICITLIILVGISRIILGVHYPTDVITGLALGILMAYFGAKVHEKVEGNFKRQILLYVTVAFFYLPFILIYLTKSFKDYESFKDLYTSYAFFLGYIVAIYLEHKFVDFNESLPFKYRIIRAFVALVIILGLKIGLDVIFPENILFDMLRYFMLSFIGLGIYPICFKKLLFYKEPERVEN